MEFGRKGEELILGKTYGGKIPLGATGSRVQERKLDRRGKLENEMGRK